MDLNDIEKIGFEHGKKGIDKFACEMIDNYYPLVISLKPIYGYEAISLINEAYERGKELAKNEILINQEDKK